MRCAEFYVCLTTPIYFTRASPPPRQEERDANQTCWLDCDHDRIGWHRGCGGLIWFRGSRGGGVSPRPRHPPRPLDPGFHPAHPRIGGVQPQIPSPPPYLCRAAPGGPPPPPHPYP